MASAYEKFLQQRMPRWLRGLWADRFTSVVAGLLDATLEGAEEAASQWFIAECADDVVESHARSRLLYRLSGETIAALRLRVLGAWDFFPAVQTTAGLRDWLRLVSNAPDLEVFDQANNNWQAGAAADNDDSNANNASRHVIVIPAPNHPWARPTVGPGLVVGPGLLVGITMTPNELSAIRAAYRRYRPANMVGIDIYVSFDPLRNAEDILEDHTSPSDYVRLPLHRAMVGYAHHGMTVGAAMFVGQEFS
jgi:hypothetical protein